MQVQAAIISLLRKVYVLQLASLYRAVFPDLSYNSCNAKEKQLKMPFNLVVIHCRSSN